jgi:hypothetical protein
MRQVLSHKILPILFIICTNFLPAFSQLKITCCGINQIIPVFKALPKASFTETPLIRQGILKPITQSKADLEIRFSRSATYNTNGIETVLLKCSDDKLTVTRYIFIIKPTNVRRDSLFHDLGASKSDTTERILLYQKEEPPNGITSWNSFFRQLIINHLFDLPPGDKIDRLVTKKNPKIHSQKSGMVNIELKVGNRYRNIVFTGFYEPQPQNVKAYNNYYQIYQLLGKL